MSLSLEQYINYLDGRVPCPAPPTVDAPRARPHLVSLPDIRAVTWNVYGTLLAVAGGDLYFVHPEEFMMNSALEKTIQEFKMWGSMTRKPGQPSEYLRELYLFELQRQQTVPAHVERHPEVDAARVWEALIKKLFANGYQFDAGSYGSLNEFSRKVAYFFHASMQGVACYPGAADALAHVASRHMFQALVANGQCFTVGQLTHELGRQRPGCNPGDWFDGSASTLSFEVRARLPSEKVFRRTLDALGQRGITPGQVLHVGSRIRNDVVPARRLGMRTALFAGDRASLEATRAQLDRPASRPDVLLTELAQINEVVK